MGKILKIDVKLMMHMMTAIRVLSKGGIPMFCQLLQAKKQQNDTRQVRYEKWIKRNEKNITRKEKTAYCPRISLIIPVCYADKNALQECIESVCEQSYENWQICMAVSAAVVQKVQDVLEQYKGDAKIKICFGENGESCSQLENRAIALATGEFIAFLEYDDMLAPHALYEVVKKLNENPTYDFIYSDEDKIAGKNKKRHMPDFKPDWSPDTLMSDMYTGHLGVYRLKLAMEIGKLRDECDGMQEYDFTLRFTEKTQRIAHIPKVLYHVRDEKAVVNAKIDQKIHQETVEKKIKEDALRRRGVKGNLEKVLDCDAGDSFWRVNYKGKTREMISIIIPSKDNPDVLERCVKSVRKKSTYHKYEIIIIDNGSSVENQKRYRAICQKYEAKYCYRKMEFNYSKMCNLGAEQSKGEFLLFLNDDTEVITADWLERLSGHAALRHAGAIGAKLYYPASKNIQHCGIANLLTGPIHVFWKKSDDMIYAYNRNRLDCNYLAVTGACLMVARKKFEKARGFDESLPVAYNDVAFGMEMVREGYYNVLRNDVQLYHYESLSRGYEWENAGKLKKMNVAGMMLNRKYPEFYPDPFYSCNFSQIKNDFQ